MAGRGHEVAAASSGNTAHHAVPSREDVAHGDGAHAPYEVQATEDDRVVGTLAVRQRGQVAGQAPVLGSPRVRDTGPARCRSAGRPRSRRRERGRRLGSPGPQAFPRPAPRLPDARRHVRGSPRRRASRRARAAPSDTARGAPSRPASSACAPSQAVQSATASSTRGSARLDASQPAVAIDHHDALRPEAARGRRRAGAASPRRSRSVLRSGRRRSGRAGPPPSASLGG